MTDLERQLRASIVILRQQKRIKSLENEVALLTGYLRIAQLRLEKQQQRKQQIGECR